MSLAQRFAQVFGAIYLLVGILGFVPVVPLLVPAELGVIGPLEVFQLGLFAVNWLHSLTHLAIGGAGLALYRIPAGARSYALAIGVLYLVLFLLGLVLPTAFGLVPLFGVPDLLLHLGTAMIALGAYYTSPRRRGPPRRPFRQGRAFLPIRRAQAI